MPSYTVKVPEDQLNAAQIIGLKVPDKSRSVIVAHAKVPAEDRQMSGPGGLRDVYESE